MTAAGTAHQKIARWYTGDKLVRTLAQAKKQCRNLDISGLGNGSELMRALRSAQDAVLMPLVEADLALFAKQAILYKPLPEKKERELFKALDDPAKIKNFKTGRRKPTLDHHKAYQYYCRVILNRDGYPSDKTPPSGMFLFFVRHPLAKRLLDRVTDHFLKNLYTCIRRISRDKVAIEACFLGGETIRAITRIQATGSDFHKGGQQVLIVHLAYVDGRGKKRKLRLVYKPSDVEFDYRITGQNRPEFTAFLEQHHDDPGFPIGHRSLYELLNDSVFKTSNQTLARLLSKKYGGDAAQLEAKLALPTYAILPRNPGSRLTTHEGEAGIRSSYGYIEYLEHYPENSPTIPAGTNGNTSELEAWIARKYRKASDRKISELDWITRSLVEALICYRLWGRIIAISTVFQQTDLHHQNLRLRGRKPHVIDLENALVKTISGPNGTAIPFNFEVPTSGQMNYRPGYTSDPPPGKLSPINKEPFSKKEWSNSSLWLLSRGGDGRVLAEPVTARGSNADPQIARQLGTGLAEALRLMVQPANRKSITRWVSDVKLKNIIVRNVVEATGELSSAVAESVRERLDNQSQTEDATLAAICERRRKGSFNRWRDLTIGMQNPYFALNNARWHGADFLNLDVPSYYQQVGSKDLMSSDGRTVTYVAPEDAEQRKAERKFKFTHYLEKTGAELLEESFAKNLPAGEELLKNRIEDFLKESGLPQASLNRILGR